MKHFIKTFFFCTIILISLSGCFNPIFYEIRKDVVPETATVNGPINQITRYTVGGKEYLVLAANDGIQYKSKANSKHGGWKTYSPSCLPFNLPGYDYFGNDYSGEQIMKVLANSEYLYVLTCSYTVGTDTSSLATPEKIRLYAAKMELSAGSSSWKETKSSWKEIELESSYFPIYADYNYSSSYYFASAFTVFQTNAPQAAHRHVYIRSGQSNTVFPNVKYYEITGNTKASVIELSGITAKEKATADINSAVWFNDSLPNDGVLFFNALAVTSDETYTDNPTRFYYSSESKIYYNETPGDDTIASRSVSSKHNILSLAYCKDAIFIGQGEKINPKDKTYSSSSGGIAKISLKADGIPDALAEFSTNASFQLSTLYQIPVVLNATPEEKELDCSVYASMVLLGSDSSGAGSYDNIGLWSYYPDRGNWNRE